MSLCKIKSMLKSVKYDLHCTLPFVALGITLAPPALPMSTLHPRVLRFCFLKSSPLKVTLASEFLFSRTYLPVCVLILVCFSSVCVLFLFLVCFSSVCVLFLVCFSSVCVLFLVCFS